MEEYLWDAWMCIHTYLKESVSIFDNAIRGSVYSIYVLSWFPQSLLPDISSMIPFHFLCPLFLKFSLCGYFFKQQSSVSWNGDWSCWLDLVQITSELMNAVATFCSQNSISQHPSPCPSPDILSAPFSEMFFDLWLTAAALCRGRRRQSMYKHTRPFLNMAM